MFGLPPVVTIVKDVDSVLDVMQQNCVQYNASGFPPVITHTAATPMATPQGSPNEFGGSSSKPRHSFSGVSWPSTCDNKVKVDTVLYLFIS